MNNNKIYRIRKLGNKLEHSLEYKGIKRLIKFEWKFLKRRFLI
jgi:hypothetical protein